ncbi:MAG: bifunctional demethylmenaquinone methyltransferase/2-methoxy-6-polyprenyl-1,4-benzoquinol methylase UbiE [Alphaproteobacteria bacterium]|jgi:demethylmenaquinone methyltransferase/2-methoxy-6-polyprenyl-1,4-benzoquinol methylase|nr:bifunctional demethylmenaquinone methyltransferase/2-methoxy-6-polyprenyl-1,4-benzoquinol methylase UbiE [Alphaproteobacteria bacterium]
MADNKDFFTNFGFKKVPFKEKAKLVKDVFDGVATNYDIMNDAMSLGIHRLWKKEIIKMITATNTKTLLDVGGGTADISLEFIEHGGELAYVVDINDNMLQVGQDKALNRGYVSSLEFICSNAEELPFKDNSMDCYTTSFCIRNVSDIQKALNEAYRVLKPGSKFFCLEFSKVENQHIAKAYDIWSFKAIPKIGEHIAKNKDAYQYLVESIRKFPPQEEFASMIRKAGFKEVGYKNLNFGIACIHYAEKI